ncbi:sugar ABC transporter ATP-binding protein [Aestuariivirga sp.]|uniref:sugar ABC transporter ATP-binding protein n=1 Tax=Aestuariivirga sp. TaxID=2650926 RepID=UPI003593BB54
MTDTVLGIRNVTRSFGPVRALRGINFDLKRGEIHAVAGENGAGKSTLMNIIDGILQPDSGEILIDGKPVRISSPAEAQRLGIGFVHQEIALCPDVSVAENIFMAATNRSRAFLMDAAGLHAKARDVLAQLSDIDPGILVRDLSISNQQLVEIAKALTLDCRILILDEPTAALTEREAQLLFGIMRKLASQGIAIIYISHRMVEIFENCDRVTVFRDGQYIRTDKVSETTPDEIVNAMVGRKIESLYPPKLQAPAGAAILQVEGLTDRRFQGVTFELRSGEILGVAGLIGAGRSEIMRGICRLEGKASGQVRLYGRVLSLQCYTDAIVEGIVYLSEDRKGDGLFLDLPIAANVSALNLGQVARAFGLIDKGAETRLAEGLGKKLGLKASGVGQKVSALSGGNQQKVALAKLLAIKPRVIFLDEPTRGVDVGAKAEIHRILRDLASEGVGILVISSELPELIGISDRVIVIADGRITGELPAEKLSEQAIMQLASNKGWQKQSA